MDQHEYMNRDEHIASLIKMAIFGHRPTSLFEEGEFIAFLNNLKEEELGYYSALGLMRNRQTSRWRDDGSN